MLNNEEKKVLEKLKNKFSDNPEELKSALEGLFHNKGLFYWDYIHTETLLSLQQPKTNFPDEIIFIVYHQICELYFLLIIHELKILTNIENKEFLEGENWIKRIGRIVNYWKHLVESIHIMQPGEKGKTNQFFSTSEFSKFRLALSPASGFQSVAIRKIELFSTSIQNLIPINQRSQMQKDLQIEELYRNIYWKSGSLMFDQKGNHSKTKTLITFEKKYDKELLELAKKLRYRNLEYLFFKYQSENEEENTHLKKIRTNATIKDILKQYDLCMNHEWKNSHLSVIRQHLNEKNYGTGGTNWKEYLPPAKQNIIFFPDLN